MYMLLESSLTSVSFFFSPFTQCNQREQKCFGNCQNSQFVDHILKHGFSLGLHDQMFWRLFQVFMLSNNSAPLKNAT